MLYRKTCGNISVSSESDDITTGLDDVSATRPRPSSLSLEEDSPIHSCLMFVNLDFGEEDARQIVGGDDPGEDVEREMCIGCDKCNSSPCSLVGENPSDSPYNMKVQMIVTNHSLDLAIVV